MLDVGTALPATREHEGRLHEHLAAIVQRGTPRAGAKTPREAISEPQPVGEAPKGVQPDVYDTAPAGFHFHANRAVNLHLGSALLALELQA
jgi:hypothetical protein